MSRHYIAIRPALFAVTMIAGCVPTKQTTSTYLRESFRQQEKSRVTYLNDWCEVIISGLPTRAFQLHLQGDAASDEQLLGSTMGWTFRVQIKNRVAAVGPLRYVSENLEQYQQRYAYLLKDAKADFFLRCGDQLMEPSGYVFTTNYSAAPLEEVLISFRNLPLSSRKNVALCYVDRLFLHDTLTYKLDGAAIARESRLQITSVHAY